MFEVDIKQIEIPSKSHDNYILGLRKFIAECPNYRILTKRTAIIYGDFSSDFLNEMLDVFREVIVVNDQPTGVVRILTAHDAKSAYNLVRFPAFDFLKLKS